MDFSSLLRPFALKSLRLRNRVVSTAHAPAYAVDGMPLARYQAYHEEKARGGAGLVMFGGSTTVSVDCPSTFGQINLSNDRAVPHLREFADRIHAHGVPLICQISHTGRRTRWDRGNWLPPIGPSAIPEPAHKAVPKVMESFDFERVTNDFAASAARCKASGIDGIELAFHAQQLVAQFFSPATNKRTDAYGGALENRVRFAEKVLAAIRAEVGEDFVIGVRICVDELIEGGVEPEEGVAIGRALVATGHVDYLNSVGGQPSDSLTASVAMPGMAYPVAPFAHLAGLLRAEAGVPVLAAQRINDAATAARLLEGGFVDLVGLTRAMIADPHFVAKLANNQPDRIRQCVGANYCVDRIYFGGEALCIQNAATGRESVGMPHVIAPSAERRRAVVVGGGPGGLEAARVLMSRRHSVVLFEAEDELGGQLNLAKRVSWREPLSGIVRWLEEEIRILGVDLRLGTRATAEAVLGQEPDLVIMASGGQPNRPLFPGRELMVSSWDVLSGRVERGENVLIYDELGSQSALSCAEVIAASGARIELVTPERNPAADVGPTNFAMHMRNLSRLSAVLTPNFYLKEVRKEGNHLAPVLTSAFSRVKEERRVDQVVFDCGTVPNSDLYEALKPASRNGGEIDYPALLSGAAQPFRGEGFDLFRVGDALSSRNVHAALYDSLRLCKGI